MQASGASFNGKNEMERNPAKRLDGKMLLPTLAPCVRKEGPWRRTRQ